jgi:hypothetical protein
MILSMYSYKRKKNDMTNSFYFGICAFYRVST